MPSVQTHIDYSFVVQMLDTNKAKAADALIEFARQTLNDSLHKDALLLKVKLNLVKTEAEKEAIANEMKLLAQKISDAPLEPVIGEPERDFQKEEFFRRGASKSIIVSCRDINKTYPKTDEDGEDFSLRHIDLVLRLGEITGLVGENGNGKTTLLKIIAGELLADSGELEFSFYEKSHGKKNWPFIKKQIAYLPQELPMITGNVVQNLRITAAVHGIKGSNNDEALDNIICRLGLMNELHKSWRQLSGGFKLRFALARILIRKPKLLILDEPLANLDINTLNALLNDLKNITHSIGEPISVILSSQHLEEVESVATNMIVLSKGAVQYNGPTAGIGSLRNENTFEIKTTLTKEQLKDRLEGFNYKSIAHTGFSFLVTTSLNITADEFMEQLIRNRIPVTYFCDISNSTRKMILNNNQDNL